MLFPNAQKDEVPDQSILATAPEDVSAQREQAPTDNSSDSSQFTTNSQSTAPSPPAVDQATFVVASPAAQSQPQNDQQQPPPQNQQPQPQPQTLNEQPQSPQPQALNEQPRAQPQVLNVQPQPQPWPTGQQTTSPQQVSNEQARSPQPQQKSEISLTPQEINRLTNLGEKMLGQGDLATARRLLEHAAQARGAQAALLLGATYDPEGLRKMGVVGMRPDLEKAHMWYARAAEFGSSEASRRLAGLGQRAH
jgi:TPR repeat protein